MGAKEDWDRFIGGVGHDIETVVTGPSNFMSDIGKAISNMSSPLLLPILGVCVAIVSYKMLEERK